MTASRLHLILAALWIPVVLGLSLRTALLGAERAALGQHRGADLAERRTLRDARDRLAAEIDWLASPPQLAEAVRRLGLPLQPGDRYAALVPR